MEVKLDKQYPLDVDSARAWALLTDLKAVASCMPGAEITEQLSETSYKGAVKVKVGPAVAQFGGTVVLIAAEAWPYQPHCWPPLPRHVPAPRSVLPMASTSACVGKLGFAAVEKTSDTPMAMFRGTSPVSAPEPQISSDPINTFESPSENCDSVNPGHALLISVRDGLLFPRPSMWMNPLAVERFAPPAAWGELPVDQP